MSEHCLQARPQASLRIAADQPLGNATEFARRLSLDMDVERGIHKFGRLFRRSQGDSTANLRTGGRGEFATFRLFQRIQILNLKRWHRSFP